LEDIILFLAKGDRNNEGITLKRLLHTDKADKIFIIMIIIFAAIPGYSIAGFAMVYALCCRLRLWLMMNAQSGTVLR